jgi:hypothetical protein
MMTATQLSDLEALRTLKARYCRYCDTKQWELFFDLFTEDAVFDVRAGASVEPDLTDGDFADMGYQVGRANIAKTVAIMSANITSVHHCHTPELELTSPDTATGIWALEDRLDYSAGPIKSVHGFGHYHETYVRQGDTWRIRTLRVTRLRVDLVMADEALAQTAREKSS